MSTYGTRLPSVRAVEMEDRALSHERSAMALAPHAHFPAVAARVIQHKRQAAKLWAEPAEERGE